MSEKTKYAIYCINSKQEKECIELGLEIVDHNDIGNFGRYNTNGEIITYEEAKSKGLLGYKKVCTSCLGKKQVSVIRNESYTDDFSGKRVNIKPTIEMVDCSRCNGTGLEPEYEGCFYCGEQSCNCDDIPEPIQEIEPQQDDIVEKINQSLLLQFLRQNTELHENNKEQEFIELLSEFINTLPSK